jgi:hypothetical protein
VRGRGCRGLWILHEEKWDGKKKEEECRGMEEWGSWGNCEFIYNPIFFFFFSPAVLEQRVGKEEVARNVKV